jgi:hypothetical protein
MHHRSVIDVDHLPTSELRNILLAAADQGAEEPVVKVLWQLNRRAEAEGADDDERRWLDDRADVHGPWFSQILSRVRRINCWVWMRMVSISLVCGVAASFRCWICLASWSGSDGQNSSRHREAWSQL